MNYMGSKSRIAKHIIPLMIANREPGTYWVEPFVGGGNLIDKVEGPRIGGDANPWVIDALTTIRDRAGDLPRNNTEFTESDYQQLRQEDSWIKGWAGFALSFGGMWMHGWRRDKEAQRDYVSEAYRSALKQSPGLQGVKLVNATYDQLDIPPKSIIYCDPPYAGTTGYQRGVFDHDKFWHWCRCKIIEGHTLFVSEYSAPRDFLCVWEKEVRSGLNVEGTQKRNTERLFKPITDLNELL